MGRYWRPIYAGRALCLAATASLNELRHDRLDAIGGDGEANAIGGRIKLGIDGGERGNTDHVALQVDQGSSTIARVNGCIGLNRILDGRSALPFGDTSFQGTHRNCALPKRYY